MRDPDHPSPCRPHWRYCRTGAAFCLPVYGPANSGIAGISHPLHPGDLLQLTPTGPAAGSHGDPRPHLQITSAITAMGSVLRRHAVCLRLRSRFRRQHTTVACIAATAGTPQETQIHCTHEYTLANQRFALAVEPDNTALLQRQQQDSARRQRGKPDIAQYAGNRTGDQSIPALSFTACQGCGGSALRPTSGG